MENAGNDLWALRQKGYLLIVATNQPDVATGITKRSTAERINDTLMRSLPITNVETCFHVASDNCECRKPRPGMLKHAAQMYGLDLSQSYMVGDRWRDVSAGAMAGCKTILIGDGYGEQIPIEPDHRVKTLREAVDVILAA